MKYLMMTLAALVLSQASQAQEHVGHGRHQQQQQQQQQYYPLRIVVRGDEAQSLYEQIVQAKGYVRDLSVSCSEPVTAASNSLATCFDRGANFTRSDRFKCYKDGNRSVSQLRYWIFDLRHNECGGDGIHPVKVN